MAEKVIESNFLILLELFFLSFVSAEFNEFSCESFVFNGIEDIAC